MLRDLASFGRGFATGFTLYHDVKVDEFVGQCRHVIFEAERVFADSVGGHHIVALALPFPVEDDTLVWILDVEVDVEFATGLDLDTYKHKKMWSVENTHSKVELLNVSDLSYK